MNAVNEALKRLREGDVPTPKERKLYIEDIRRQRMLYKGGKKPKNDDDEQKAEVLKTFRDSQPPKPKLIRRA